MSLLQAPAGTIEVAEWGSGETSFVLLHASATGPQSLSGLASHLLRPDRRLVAPAFVGYGRTQWVSAKGRDRLEANQAIVQAVLQARPTPRRILFGHSMGGTVALSVALEEQRRGNPYDAVVLYEPVLVDLLDLQQPAQADAYHWDRAIIEFLARQVSDGHPEAGVRHFVDAWNETAWDALPAPARRALTANSGNLVEETASVSAYKINPSRLAAFATPTVLLRGSLSPALIAFTTERAAHIIPHASQSIIDGCGHMGPLLQPATIASRIEMHLTALGL